MNTQNAELALKTLLLDQTGKDLNEFRQYDEFFDGPEWRVATITKRVTTKMGVAFEPGDVTLIKVGDEVHGPETFTAYSHRTKMVTLLPGHVKPRFLNERLVTDAAEG